MSDRRIAPPKTLRLPATCASTWPASRPSRFRALANLKRLCEEHLDSDYEIEVVDLLEHPRLAAGDEIVAIPTLVRRLPTPMRKIIGDLSDPERVIVGLQLLAKDG